MAQDTRATFSGTFNRTAPTTAYSAPGKTFALTFEFLNQPYRTDQPAPPLIVRNVVYSMSGVTLNTLTSVRAYGGGAPWAPLTFSLEGGYAVFDFSPTNSLYAVNSSPDSISLIPGTYPVRAVTFGVDGRLAHAMAGATLKVEAYP